MPLGSLLGTAEWNGAVGPRGHRTLVVAGGTRFRADKVAAFPKGAGLAEVVAKKDLAGLAGRDLGFSSWVRVDQDRIDAFAETTGDHQFIHVDPGLAAQTPFGSTIAHGFLTLSLVVPMFYELEIALEGQVMGINYGMDRLRFLAPVKVGSRIRLHADVDSVTERTPGNFLFAHDITVEIEGSERPALVGRFLTLKVAPD
jgi:acyl dehydratase